MLAFIGYASIFAFFVINFYILRSDLRHKIIPNKALLALVILSPICYIASPFLSINFGILAGILTTALVSFGLYYFNVWSAGDAKYLLTLGLFLGNNSILGFVGNLALLTIGLLLIHTIYVYSIKTLFDPHHRAHLYQSTFLDIIAKCKEAFTDPRIKKITFLSVLKKVFPILLGFIIFFTALRLIRIYVVAALVQAHSDGEDLGMSRMQWFLNLIIEYNVYILLGIIALIIITFRAIYRFTRIGFDALCVRLKLSRERGQLYALGGISIILLAFISYQYLIDPLFIQENLIRIFTFYIFIYALFRLGLYCYQITFTLAEVRQFHYSKLRAGDLVDTDHLVKFFGEQSCLGYKNEKGKLYPSPAKYFESIENPIDKKTAKKIRDVYKIVENFYKKTPGFDMMDQVKITRTFAFAPYIFAGICVTLIAGNSIMMFLITTLFEFLGLL